MPSPLPNDLRVLAIDPGNTESAFCQLYGDRRIGDFGKVSNATLRGRVELTERFPTAVVAIEMIASYGMPVGKEVFETCIQIGRLFQLSPLPVVFVPRLQVKLNICKSTRANDSTIRTALIDLFGPPGTKKAPGKTYGFSKDCWAALALAETVRSGDFTPYSLEENSASPSQSV
jgi:hypothetical protein